MWLGSGPITPSPPCSHDQVLIIIHQTPSVPKGAESDRWTALRQAEVMRWLRLPWDSQREAGNAADVLVNDVVVPWIQIQVTKDLNPRQYIYACSLKLYKNWFDQSFLSEIYFDSFGCYCDKDSSIYLFLDCSTARGAWNSTSYWVPWIKSDNVFLHQSCYELTILHFGRTEGYKDNFVPWIYTDSTT